MAPILGVVGCGIDHGLQLGDLQKDSFSLVDLRELDAERIPEDKLNSHPDVFISVAEATEAADELGVYTERPIIWATDIAHYIAFRVSEADDYVLECVVDSEVSCSVPDDAPQY